MAELYEPSWLFNTDIEAKAINDDRYRSGKAREKRRLSWPALIAALLAGGPIIAVAVIYILDLLRH